MTWKESKHYYEDVREETTRWGEDVDIVGEIPRIGPIRPFYIIWKAVSDRVVEMFIDKEAIDKT